MKITYNPSNSYRELIAKKDLHGFDKALANAVNAKPKTLYGLVSLLRDSTGKELTELNSPAIIGNTLIDVHHEGQYTELDPLAQFVTYEYPNLIVFFYPDKYFVILWGNEVFISRFY